MSSYEIDSVSKLDSGLLVPSDQRLLAMEGSYGSRPFAPVRRNGFKNELIRVELNVS